MSNIIGGYEFKDQNLLNQALTHISFSKKNYERLEFLGDSILDFLVAEIIFKDKQKQQDELSRIRANIVSEDALYKIFDRLDIEHMVRLAKGMNGPTKAIKADMVESLIAVIYLESGIDECKKFILNNLDLSASSNKDYKTEFQEYAQKFRVRYKYNLDKTEGPAHNLTFFISLVVEGKTIASSSASSKLEAEKMCAKQALLILNKK